MAKAKDSGQKAADAYNWSRGRNPEDLDSRLDSQAPQSRRSDDLDRKWRTDRGTTQLTDQAPAEQRDWRTMTPDELKRHDAKNWSQGRTDLLSDSSDSLAPQPGADDPTDRKWRTNRQRGMSINTDSMPMPDATTEHDANRRWKVNRNSKIDQDAKPWSPMSGPPVTYGGGIDNEADLERYLDRWWESEICKTRDPERRAAWPQFRANVLAGGIMHCNPRSLEKAWRTHILRNT
ncbi:MAG: hypothetical protein F4171_15655 [Gammaproteobacteria bacterium]|nr:hypothetical protein [Gammaproteobacteria bacterium]MYG14207.1 hypothetical protein [Gammaproteobacteria bacterium]MYK27227.1 hypothetical protein [Gammaproteobacteria bacterium]